MADNPKTTGKGGNTPKPAGPGGPQSAKDRSRAASRPVTGKPATKGGNAPRPPGGRSSAPTPTPPGRRGMLLAWGGIGLVIVVVVALVIFFVADKGTQASGYTPVTPAPAQVVQEISSIPLSTWNKVGVVGVSSKQVQAPTVLKGQPALTLSGKSPAMLYYGAEYCPYCAAERWAMATALARFGTWHNLQITASSWTDVAAKTHTFSFHGASVDSPYIEFQPVEQYTNIPVASTPGEYTNLQNPNKQQAAILTKYSSSKYLPNASSNGGISFPFVDINNQLLISGASYDPQLLAGLDWTDIASGLSNANNPVTQVILTTANLMSAGICEATKGQPGDVCKSAGVQAAAKSLGISVG